ncbi:tetratricopeptide repeat protein [Aquimarina aquimarini]|uniref:tetratricopeptide repeat protein n=1 Tax=Aquimarina aquimarini TaxID=1191734 RepID=UPI000D560EF6|nr:tetratricopeptide repeat protein [Aquimarina aquimarini]
MSYLEKEIEAYLNGEMTLDQRKIFEKKVADDSEVKKELELYIEMNTIYDETDWEVTSSAIQHPKVLQHETFLKSDKGKSIKKSIANAEKVYFDKEKSNRRKQYFLRYAISIAAVLILGIYITSKFGTTMDHNNLYMKHKNWEELPSLTSRGNNTDLTKGEKMFKQQNYQEAVKIFKKHQLESSEDINPQIVVYVGVAYLELEQHKLAIESFEQLKESNTLDATKAYWYLALTYLKMNQESKAKENLQILAGDTTAYKHQEALELIKALQ